MTSAGHHTMFGAGGAPSVFRHVALKIVACRFLRSSGSLSALRALTPKMMKQSCIRFVDSNGSMFSIPSGTMITGYTSFDGVNMYTDAGSISDWSMGNLLDGSTSTQWDGPYIAHGYARNKRNVYTEDGTVLMDKTAASGTYGESFIQQHFGTYNKATPVAWALDFQSLAFDVSIYSRWQFYTANDTTSSAAGNGDRQWVEGEILGSVDGATWWRLDVFNDANMPTVNYGLAYTGDLVPRKGGIWTDLDLMDRDWANGIAVDSYQQGGGKWIEAFPSLWCLSRCTRSAWKEVA